MSTLDILNHDCLINVFMYLDVESLTNVVTIDRERHLAAAKTVFKRKFRSEHTTLDTSDESTAQDYLLRLNYFGDLIQKLHIAVPSPDMPAILTAVHDRCQQSLLELVYHQAAVPENDVNRFIEITEQCQRRFLSESELYEAIQHLDTIDDESPVDEDENSRAMRWFFQHLNDFTRLHSLVCKYGDLYSNSGRFDRLNIRIPAVPSLLKLTLDGFGGRLEENTTRFLDLNPQIEDFSLWTGYENLHSSYLKYIAEKMRRVKTLDLSFAVFFPIDGGMKSINFENLEKLRVVCFFNLSSNFLPFFGDTMNKLESLEYIATKTNFQLANIVSQFKHLKSLKIGSNGMEDEHLMILGEGLEKIELLHIADLPCNVPMACSFTANGIMKFLGEREGLRFFIQLNEMNYEVNMELISNIKHILHATRWRVLEQHSTQNRFVLVF